MIEYYSASIYLYTYLLKGRIIVDVVVGSHIIGKENGYRAPFLVFEGDLVLFCITSMIHACVFQIIFLYDVKKIPKAKSTGFSFIRVKIYVLW